MRWKLCDEVGNASLPVILVIDADIVEIEQDVAVGTFGNATQEVGFGQCADIGVVGGVLDADALLERILHLAYPVTDADDLGLRKGNGEEIVKLVSIATGCQMVGIVIGANIVDQFAQITQKVPAELARPAEI